MLRSTSNSSTRPEPRREPLGHEGGPVVTVDVEEWYHNCWCPEYVDPARRPALPEELDRAIPELLARFDRLGVRATFFVLGEVAERLPERIREVRAAGHEVASHGELHLRAGDRSPAAFRADIERARARLEELLGEAVVGFRAPEWSIRSPADPRLRIVAEVGYGYDSSLMAARGAGRRSNPRCPTRFVWPDGASLTELPPLVWGRWQLPAGGWTGRLAPRRPILDAIDASPLPILVVHPWELVDRPCPGPLTGFARWFHEAGRIGFGDRFDRLAADRPAARTLGEITALDGAAAHALDLEETDVRWPLALAEGG